MYLLPFTRQATAVHRFMFWLIYRIFDSRFVTMQYAAQSVGVGMWWWSFYHHRIRAFRSEVAEMLRTGRLYRELAVRAKREESQSVAAAAESRDL